MGEGGRRSRKQEGREVKVLQWRACSLPHCPPGSASSASPGRGIEARDWEECPSTALHQLLTKTGQAKPPNVFHPSLGSMALSALPPVPPLQRCPTCSFLFSPSHHALPYKDPSGSRVTITGLSGRPN